MKVLYLERGIREARRVGKGIPRAVNPFLTLTHCLLILIFLTHCLLTKTALSPFLFRTSQPSRIGYPHPHFPHCDDGGDAHCGDGDDGGDGDCCGGFEDDDDRPGRSFSSLSASGKLGQICSSPICTNNMQTLNTQRGGPFASHYYIHPSPPPCNTISPPLLAQLVNSRFGNKSI